MLLSSNEAQDEHKIGNKHPKLQITKTTQSYSTHRLVIPDNLFSYKTRKQIPSSKGTLTRITRKQRQLHTNDIQKHSNAVETPLNVIGTSKYQFCWAEINVYDGTPGSPPYFAY